MFTQFITKMGLSHRLVFNDKKLFPINTVTIQILFYRSMLNLNTALNCDEFFNDSLRSIFVLNYFT